MLVTLCALVAVAGLMLVLAVWHLERQTDRDLYSASVKARVFNVLLKRGAVDPVLSQMRCSWSIDTVADCTGTAYENCGIHLCNRSQAYARAYAHAVCATRQGDDCTIEVTVELLPHGDGGRKLAAQATTVLCAHGGPCKATVIRRLAGDVWLLRIDRGSAGATCKTVDVSKFDGTPTHGVAGGSCTTAELLDLNHKN